MNIHDLITDHGIAAIASKLGVSRKTVYAWRQGTRGITPSRAIQIEKAFGVPRSALRPDLWRKTDVA